MDNNHFISFNEYTNELIIETNCLIEEIVHRRMGRKHVTILDIGCGTGEKMQYISPHVVSAIGIDICPDLVNFSIYNEIIIGDILDPVIPTRSVDLAVASHVLSYVPEEKYYAFVNNSLSHVNENGLLCMIEMVGDGILGEIKTRVLGKKFIGTSEKFSNYLNKTHTRVETLHLCARVKTSDLSKLKAVINFFCEKYQMKLQKQSKKIDTILKGLLTTEGYILPYSLKVYVIQKSHYS